MDVAVDVHLDPKFARLHRLHPALYSAAFTAYLAVVAASSGSHSTTPGHRYCLSTPRYLPRYERSACSTPGGALPPGPGLRGSCPPSNAARRPARAAAGVDAPRMACRREAAIPKGAVVERPLSEGRAALDPFRSVPIRSDPAVPIQALVRRTRKSTLMSSDHHYNILCPHVPARFRLALFDGVDPTVGNAVALALNTMRRLAAGDVRSALISGPSGVAKSHMAAAACNEIARPLIDEAERLKPDLDAFQRLPAAERNDIWDEFRDALSVGAEWCPRWVSVPLVLGSLKREMTDSDQPTHRLLEDVFIGSGLLVLDDIAAEKATEWSMSTLFELVSARYDAGRQILITSNKTARQLSQSGYEPIVSRVADGGCLIDMASAQDYRMTHLRQSVIRPVPADQGPAEQQ